MLHPYAESTPHSLLLWDSLIRSDASQEKIFCVHSGLSPELETVQGPSLQGLRDLDRHGDYGDTGTPQGLSTRFKVDLNPQP